jgi:hypothetical protein
LPIQAQLNKSPCSSASRLVIPGGFFEPDPRPPIHTGHAYFDDLGNRVLSVTQIFGMLGMVDYSHVPPNALKHKAEIGVAVHRAIELLLQDQLDWDTVDEEAMAYVVGAESWFRDAQFKLASCEQQGIHEVRGMKFGYQYDQRGSIFYEGRFRPVIVDLKTAIEKSSTWALQTAAYALAAPAIGQERYLRVVLHLQKDGRVKPLYYSDPTDENAFLYMAYAAIWKQNHGYKLAA